MADTGIATDHDPGRLSPRPTALGGLRPAMAADRAIRGSPACAPRQEWDCQRTSDPRVTRYVHFVSYAATTSKMPTYSFPSEAGQSVLLASTGSSTAAASLPRVHSR